MKIDNDTISFDAVDFDSLSDFAKKALAAYVGERLEFQNVLADDLNKTVEAAKQNLIHVTQSGDDVALVLRKLAAADPVKFDEALTAIGAVLESVVAESPAVKV